MSAGADLGQVDVTGDDASEAAVGVEHQGRTAAGGVDDGSTLGVGVGRRTDAGERSGELGAAIEIQGAAVVDGETIVIKQRIDLAGLEAKGAAVDVGGAADELRDVEVQGAGKVLGKTTGRAESAGDRQRLAAGDMDDGFAGAGRAERDHRDAQRRRCAGAGSGGQDRT